MDITFGRTVLGEMRNVKDPRDILMQEINVLMYMVPGFDPYNPDKGINISEFHKSVLTTELKMKLEDRIKYNLETFMSARFISLEYLEDTETNEVNLILDFMKDGQSFLIKLNPSSSNNTLVVNKDY